MSRRSVSPIRPIQPRSETDPRDNIIRKLKDDLIVARGKEKQMALLENYYVELIQKNKLLSAETAKSDEEGKLKLELSLKSINDLKKELEGLKIQLRNRTNQLRSIEQEEDEIKKHLHGRVIEIQKLKKQGICLHEDNEKLLTEQYRLRSQEDQLLHDIKKLQQAIHSFQARLSQITRKILEVKSYIDGLKDENTHLKDRLKQYENDNSGIGKNLDQKQNRIDDLQRTFSQKHENIKQLVERYIQIEHGHDKNLKEVMHKNNLAKIQNEKHIEMNNHIKRLQRIINDRKKELSGIEVESDEVNKANEQFFTDNQKIKKDIAYCQEHLQNLLKHNALVQEQMESVMREDQAVISIIRRKRLMPPNNNYNSIRSSRDQAKLTAKTYK